jgi:energy-coupling factor transporter ATP-binding protein EcfA2
MAIGNTKPDSPRGGTPNPAYFLSLRVSNFRCFGDSSNVLDLSTTDGHPSRWNIIVGENGTGKTTILQCLVALQGIEQRGESSQEKVSAAYVPIISSLASEPTPSYLKSIKQEGHNWHLESSVIAGHEALISGQGERVKSYGYRKRYRGLQGRNSNTYMFIPQRSTIDISGLTCYGYGASRRMGRKVALQTDIDDNCVTLFDDATSLIDAEDWLLRADYAVKSQPRNRAARQRLQIVESTLQRLLPDVASFRFEVSDDSSMSPRVEAETPYGWVSIRNLSLGYKTALTWIVDLAARLYIRYPESSNPLGEPAVVLIDEIDLHLHPKWQLDLLELLDNTFLKTQFIVTAHSPLVVQAVPDANIALLRRKGNYVEIVNDVDEIRNWRVDQILTSDLFGLGTTRSPKVQKLIDERNRILAKKRLTIHDRERLGELDSEIGRLPTAANPEDQKAMDLIREAATLLREKRLGEANPQ